MRKFEWVTVAFEGDRYDVCVGIEVEQVDEIRPIDSEINIMPVMHERVIDWMEEQAVSELSLRELEVPFRDMSAAETEIDDRGMWFDYAHDEAA